MWKHLAMIVVVSFMAASCSSFKAERLDDKVSDEKALEITDKWVAQDTTNAITEVMTQIKNHKGLAKYLAQKHDQPKIFIGEIQNRTSEAYFPIDDLNEELLTELSAGGDFVLVDAQARQAILKEITYQNDGMVDPMTAKSIGKQTGADLMIFGSVEMTTATRDGKTIKQYSVNIRMTDIEKATEVMRARTKTSKYSQQSSAGW